MRRRPARSLWLAVVALAPVHAFAQAPLDPGNLATRQVSVQLENSPGLATVGQSFGPAVPATYFVSGGVGTLVIPIASHEEMREGSFWEAVPGSFSEYVIQIDLATLHATSVPPTTGAMESNELNMSFSQDVITSNATAGFVGPSGIGTLLCTSQAQVDLWCLTVHPIFCGKTCTLVSGSAYDPGSGKLNMVGGTTEQGCDGGICNGPFIFFSPYGDLRLLDGPPGVPALPWPAALALALGLAAAAAASHRRRHP
jgi:hypothetical protein